MSSFFVSFLNTLVGNTTQDSLEETKIDKKDLNTNRVFHKHLREMNSDGMAGGNDNNDNYSGRGDRDHDRDVDWGRVVNNAAQGGLNLCNAANNVKNGNPIQAIAETVLAAENAYEVADELGKPIGEVLTQVGNEINKEDVYWGGL